MSEVEALIGAIDNQNRQRDARALDALFRKVTGWQPRLWSGRMIGYGRYHYRYESGREGDCLATGFAVQKSKFSIYIMPGYNDFAEITARLGKHKRGKACLYVNKLADIDQDALADLIRAGLDDLARRWTVLPG